jgi:hypothetical protein
MRLTGLHNMRWGRALLVLASVLAVSSCRRNRFPSRGDAAAVVVVAARSDAAVSPRVLEQEPNDSPEQAQLLAINPDWPVLSVDGTLSGPDKGKGRDVDVFKLLVPGHRQEPAAIAATPDSAQSDDPRLSARRLALEIASEGARGLSLQVLDDGLKSMETISVDASDVAGMPNLAVLPGRTYYFRVKAIAKPAKSPEMQPTSQTYKLTVQLGDFDLAEEREPNDSLESAQPVVVVGAADFAGFLGWQHDQDYYRIPAPEVASGLDVDMDALEGVAATLQVLDGGGVRIASGRGRRGERLALHNVTVPAAVPDAGAGSRFLYVVVRGDSGQNRTQRYVLHLTMGMLRQDAEIEPNDNPTNATAVHDGTITGFLPVGDVDYFRYVGEGQREVTFEVACPSRVRGKVEVVRQSDGLVLATAEAKKAKQTVVLAKVPSLGEPLLVRLSQGKGDGNPNEPYSLKIGSAAMPAQNTGATNSPSPLNPD